MSLCFPSTIESSWCGKTIALWREGSAYCLRFSSHHLCFPPDVNPSTYFFYIIFLKLFFLFHLSPTHLPFPLSNRQTIYTIFCSCFQIGERRCNSTGVPKTISSNINTTTKFIIGTDHDKCIGGKGHPKTICRKAIHQH